MKILDENLGESMDVAVGISPKSQIENLKDKVNQFLAQAKAEGTLDEMYDRWVSRAEGRNSICFRLSSVAFKFAIMQSMSPACAAAMIPS